VSLQVEVHSSYDTQSYPPLVLEMHLQSSSSKSTVHMNVSGCVAECIEEERETDPALAMAHANAEQPLFVVSTQPDFKQKEDCSAQA
jgi:hypothetical protein